MRKLLYLVALAIFLSGRSSTVVAQVPAGAAARAIPVLVGAGKWIASALGQILLGKAIDRVTGEGVEAQLKAIQQELNRETVTDSAMVKLLHEQIALTESYLSTMRLLLTRTSLSTMDVRAAQQQADADRGRLLDMLTHAVREYGLRIDRLETTTDTLQTRMRRIGEVATRLLDSIRTELDTTPRDPYLLQWQSELRVQILRDSINALRYRHIQEYNSAQPVLAATITLMEFPRLLDEQNRASGLLITADYTRGPKLAGSVGVVALGQSYIGGFCGLSSRAFPFLLPLAIEPVHALIEVGATLGYRRAPETPSPDVDHTSGITGGAIAAAGLGYGVGMLSLRIGAAASTLSRGRDFIAKAYFIGMTAGW